MKRGLIALCCVVLCPVLLMAGPTLIIDADGNLFYSATGSGDAVLIESVIRLPGAPDGPTDPDPDPDPEPTGRVAQIAELSEAVNDPPSASILAAIVHGVLVTNDIAEDKGEAAWDGAVGVTIAANNGPKEDDWKQWKLDVEALAEEIGRAHV